MKNQFQEFYQKGLEDAFALIRRGMNQGLTAEQSLECAERSVVKTFSVAVAK